MATNPPRQPGQWLDDLESIRALLGDDAQAGLPFDESIDPQSIPLLSEIVEPGADSPAPAARKPAPEPAPMAPRSTPSRADRQLDSEIRAAANLILQDVIDDFVPQIEAELKRRLERLLKRKHPDLF
ncbi:hypothetical protein [Stutzerimonas azotifigens]|uniref:hypothetical protein n=1 Tax=Stutzerimonas azotifigens TaxID=291995 RepID=UPI0003F517B5|nr:hypothetical protein [Stutzerimonas azotifigens]